MKVMGIYNAYNPLINEDNSKGSSQNQNKNNGNEKKEKDSEDLSNQALMNIKMPASNYYRKSIDSLFTNFRPNIPSKILLKINNLSGNVSLSNGNKQFGDSLSGIIPQNPVFKVDNNDGLTGFEKIRQNHRYTKSKKAVNKLKYQFGLSIELLKRKEYIAAIAYLESALKLAESINYEKSMFVIFELLARTNDKLSDLTQALDYYLKAYEIADSKNIISKKVQIANNIASIYADYSAYEKSIEWYKKAYRFSRGLNDLTISEQILEDLVIAKKYQQIQEERVA